MSLLHFALFLTLKISFNPHSEPRISSALKTRPPNPGPRHPLTRSYFYYAYSKMESVLPPEIRSLGRCFHFPPLSYAWPFYPQLAAGNIPNDNHADDGRQGERHTAQLQHKRNGGSFPTGTVLSVKQLDSMLPAAQCPHPLSANAVRHPGSRSLDKAFQIRRPPLSAYPEI